MTSSGSGRPGRGGPRAPTLLAASLLWAAGAGGALAQNSANNPIDNLSERLIQMRAEVEQLNSELTSLREQHRNRMAGLARQRGQIEGAIEQAQLQVQQARSQLAAAKEKAKTAGADADELRPVVMAVLDETEEMVAASLPFKREERLAELEDLRSSLEQGVIGPHKAVNSLWVFYQDALRLTGDNGLYQQTVRIDGEEQLAEVARLGMVMMFYRTDEDHYGSVMRDQGDWVYRAIADEHRGLAADLFEAFQKQIRTGYFRLPQAFGESRIQSALAAGAATPGSSGAEVAATGLRGSPQ